MTTLGSKRLTRDADPLLHRCAYTVDARREFRRPATEPRRADGDNLLPAVGQRFRCNLSGSSNDNSSQHINISRMTIGEGGRMKIRMTLILTVMLALAGIGAPMAETAETKAQWQAWIGQMKSSARGPFARIRWFCNDGSVLPPNNPRERCNAVLCTCPPDSAPRPDCAPLLVAIWRHLRVSATSGLTAQRQARFGTPSTACSGGCQRN